MPFHYPHAMIFISQRLFPRQIKIWQGVSPHEKEGLQNHRSVMLLIAAVFVAYALTHLEATCLLSVTVTRCLYGLYAFIMAVLLIAPVKDS